MKFCSEVRLNFGRDFLFSLGDARECDRAREGVTILAGEGVSKK